MYILTTYAKDAYGDVDDTLKDKGNSLSSRRSCASLKSHNTFVSNFNKDVESAKFNSTTESKKYLPSTSNSQLTSITDISSPSYSKLTIIQNQRSIANSNYNKFQSVIDPKKKRYESCPK